MASFQTLNHGLQGQSKVSWGCVHRRPLMPNQNKEHCSLGRPSLDHRHMCLYSNKSEENKKWKTKSWNEWLTNRLQSSQYFATYAMSWASFTGRYCWTANRIDNRFNTNARLIYADLQKSVLWEVNWLRKTKVDVKTICLSNLVI